MKILNSIIIIAITLPFISCTKVIDIDLNESSPKYVIEGNITDQAGTYEVKMTKTVNFDESNNYPPVSGTFITISDNNTGDIDTLAETLPGRYFTSKVTGISGHTYYLTVNIAGQTFSAVSTMPQLVNLDTLLQDNDIFGSAPVVIPKYTDPAGIANYYLLWVTKNGILQNDVLVRNDMGSDGAVASEPLWTDAGVGDTISVEMQCIDKANYDYFFGLCEVINQSSATPSNPASNIAGGALGYFKAHTTQRKSIIIGPSI